MTPSQASAGGAESLRGAAGLRVPSHGEQRAVTGNRQAELSSETAGLSLDSEKQHQQNGGWFGQF